MTRKDVYLNAKKKKKKAVKLFYVGHKPKPHGNFLLFLSSVCLIFLWEILKKNYPYPLVHKIQLNRRPF